MAYIDTQYLGKCETCRHCVGEIKCNTYCDHGEEYSPNLSKIPTADVAPRNEVARKIFEEIDDIFLMFKPQYFVDAPNLNYKRLTDLFSKLKKKYSEKGGNND
jgi:hypothetical protein